MTTPVHGDGLSRLASAVRGFVGRRVFLKKILVVAGGTAVAQGLGVLVAPVLTRLYTPLEFGTLATYVAVLSMVLVVSTLRYELAIPLPESEDDAFHLLLLSLLSLVSLTLVCTVGVFLFGGPLVDWLNIRELQPYLWLLPLSLLGAGGYQALNYWAVRKQEFGAISRTKVSQGLSQVVVQLLVGWLAPGPVGLLAGDAVGRIGGSGTLAALVRRQAKKSAYRVSRAQLWSVAKRYGRFPLLSVASGLLNTAGLQLPTLLLVSFYGPAVSGSFSLGQRLLATPMALIGMAVSQVFAAEMAQHRREAPERMGGLLHRTAIRLVGIGVIPLVLLAIGGPWLFQRLFGQEWGQAGAMVRTLSAMFVVQFAVVPLSQTLNVLERQDWQLGWDLGRLILVVGALWCASRLHWDADRAIIAYSVAMFVAYVALYALNSWAVWLCVKQQHIKH